MGVRQLILEFSEIDLSHVVADLAEIRRYNPQRFEMEQITAIVLDDPQRGICVGYKDCQHRSSGSVGTCRHGLFFQAF